MSHRFVQATVAGSILLAMLTTPGAAQRIEETIERDVERAADLVQTGRLADASEEVFRQLERYLADGKTQEATALLVTIEEPLDEVARGRRAGEAQRLANRELRAGVRARVFAAAEQLTTDGKPLDAAKLVPGVLSAVWIGEEHLPDVVRLLASAQAALKARSAELVVRLDQTGCPRRRRKRSSGSSTAIAAWCP
jgi:hypothetical protein